MLCNMRGVGRNDDGKKKGMVAHPRVLTQRTPVLRGGKMLSLLGAALLGAACCFLRAALLGAAFLCSCHSVCFSFRLVLPRTQDTVAFVLLCTSLNDTQHIVVYIYFAHGCQLFFSEGIATE